MKRTHDVAQVAAGLARSRKDTLIGEDTKMRNQAKHVGRLKKEHDDCKGAAYPHARVLVSLFREGSA